MEPLDKIKWLSAAELEPNFWNPNAVFGPELRLLKALIMEHGWVQPLLVNRDHLIIDGFHRWRLSLDDKEMLARYAGLVPCSILDIDEREAMLLTVGMNRAKGKAIAIRMSHLIRRLAEEHGMTSEAIAGRIGGTAQEVETLMDSSVWSNLKLDGYKYSKAWVPAESGAPPRAYKKS